MSFNTDYMIHNASYSSYVHIIIPITAVIGSTCYVELMAYHPNGMVTLNAHYHIHRGKPLEISMSGTNQTNIQVRVNGKPNPSIKVRLPEQVHLLSLITKLISSHRLDIAI